MDCFVVSSLAMTEDMVRLEGLEPPRLTAPEPKSGASTNFATAAYVLEKRYRIFYASCQYKKQ